MKIFSFDISPNSQKVLKHDLEWLCILKSTHLLMKTGANDVILPWYSNYSGKRRNFTPTIEEISKVSSSFGDLTISPSSFCKTAPFFGEKDSSFDPQELNPQTKLILDKLGIKKNSFATFKKKIHQKKK